MVLYPSTNEYGGVPEWPKGADCKSVGNAFGGSNPPSSTSAKELVTAAVTGFLHFRSEMPPERFHLPKSTIFFNGISAAAQDRYFSSGRAYFYSVASLYNNAPKNVTVSFPLLYLIPACCASLLTKIP